MKRVLVTACLLFAFNASAITHTRKNLKDATDSCSEKMAEEIYKQIFNADFPVGGLVFNGSNVNEYPPVTTPVGPGEKWVQIGMTIQDFDGCTIAMIQTGNDFTIEVSSSLTPNGFNCQQLANGIPKFSLRLPSGGLPPYFLYKNTWATPVYDPSGKVIPDAEVISATLIAQPPNSSMTVPLEYKTTGTNSNYAVDLTGYTDCLSRTLGSTQVK